MGFSIDYGFGALGALIIGALICVGAIVLVVFLVGAKSVHDDIVEEKHDRGEDGPIASVTGIARH